MTQFGCICIIPARGGSKGVPRKNVKLLNGKPLLAYMIETAQGSAHIQEIFVSTDDEEIKDVSQECGARVIDRPDELGGDTITSEAVLLHALKELKKQQAVSDQTICVFAQATSPLTRPSDLDNLVVCLNEEGFDTAAFYVEDYGHFFGLDDMRRERVPRQKREPRKREAGNAWAFRVGAFLREQRRLYGHIGLVQIEAPRDLEIDTSDDFHLIEVILKNPLHKGD